MRVKYRRWKIEQSTIPGVRGLRYVSNLSLFIYHNPPSKYKGIGYWYSRDFHMGESINELNVFYKSIGMNRTPPKKLK